MSENTSLVHKRKDLCVWDYDLYTSPKDGFNTSRASLAQQPFISSFHNAPQRLLGESDEYRAHVCLVKRVPTQLLCLLCLEKCQTFKLHQTHMTFTQP